MDIGQLKGIGPKRADCFRRLGISTGEELLADAPVRYEDHSHCTSISDLTNGMNLIHARLVRVGRPIYLRGKRSLLRCEVEDDTGTLFVVWHNQPYRARNLRVGDSFYFYGSYQESTKALQDPVLEREVPNPSSDFFGFQPIYALTEGLTQRIRRSAVRDALKRSVIRDPLSEEWLQRAGLEPLSKHYEHLHFPQSAEVKDRAVREERYRLALEEVLVTHALAALRQKKRSPKLYPVDCKPVLSKLAYELTVSQKDALAKLVGQLLAPQPMNCLLQGEVGSGKTILAFLLAYMTLCNGYSVAMMAPTEVLARQHAKKAEDLFGSENLFLLTGSTSPSDRCRILERAQSAPAGFFVGTHALFQDSVHFSKLGLVITDEQHRFGVEQRRRLQEKMEEPNTLVISATPIPRTLDLIRWGDLAMVRLQGRPPGRKGVLTRVIPRKLEREAYAGIGRQVLLGHQAYVVCPLIHAGDEDLGYWSVENVLSRVRTSLQKVSVQGREVVVESLTGEQSAEEKESRMRRFQSGEISVLVSTTVIEVGVDVANATVMLIVGADRFGLAQLHQLRGRVGRGTAASYCLLLPHSPSTNALQRLSLLERTQDGFEIARRDLMDRGAGSRLGTAQHGVLLTEEDDPSRQEARCWAQEFLRKEFSHFPTWNEIPDALQNRVRDRLNRLRRITFN